MAEFCVCCSKPSEYSILMAVGAQAERLIAQPRYRQAENDQLSIKPV
jgi:hypothetical protein